MVKAFFIPGLVWAATFGQGPLPAPTRLELQWDRDVLAPLQEGLAVLARDRLLSDLEKKPLQTSDPALALEKLNLTPKVNTLPTVLVDQDLGSIFPLTRAEPLVPHFYVNRGKLAQTFFEIYFYSKNARLDALEKMELLFEKLRYLSTWSKNISPARLPATPPFKLAAHFSPTRSVRPPFLPLKLNPGVLTLPLATPLASQIPLADFKRLKLEIEGAVDTHWNQSPFARSNGVQFKILWKEFGVKDPIPDNHALMVGGGKATYVAYLPKQIPVLFLGAHTINPRTIAHELGHVMGFADCYVRTIESLGFAGIQILEWDNPYFDDELMCNNQSGVAQSLQW